ncbi:hypothetical protein JOQ06_008339, partial [Pogonophryne albipinna]
LSYVMSGWHYFVCLVEFNNDSNPFQVDCLHMFTPPDFHDTDDEDSFRDIEIGILLVEHEGAGPSSSLHRSPASLKIILEGQVVIDNIQDL